MHGAKKGVLGGTKKASLNYGEYARQKGEAMAKNEPLRRIDCRAYDECLDAAARRRGGRLACRDCQRFEAAEPVVLSRRDIEGFAHLWMAVFRPTKRRKRDGD